MAAFDERHGQAAKAAGLKPGDDILSVDGKRIDSANDLQQALRRSDGTVELTVLRGGQEKRLKLSPVISDTGPKLGVYIREGISGIGTVTYYDPRTGAFGALGHGVSNEAGGKGDVTGGTLLSANVQSVRKGLAGKPGQLKGSVTGEVLGTLERSCPLGVFGRCEDFPGQALPVGQAKPGQAQILSNVQGQTVETFSVEILRLYDRPERQGRDLMLRVTDERLLELTGGIVAGMSGSPILQDGRIVGAVTHVLVNDPTTGYGIFIENMLEAAA